MLKSSEERRMIHHGLTMLVLKQVDYSDQLFDDFLSIISARWVIPKLMSGSEETIVDEDIIEVIQFLEEITDSFDMISW
jgi:hypothetical protein